VDTANVTVTCSSFSISIAASQLSPGTKYEIAYTFQPSPNVGAPPIVGSIPLTADASQVFDTTIWGSFAPLVGSYTFTGTASLVGHNTIPIQFSPTSLTCGPQPPPKTSGKGIDTASFDGTPIAEGDVVWFNANFSVTGVPKTGGVITFTSSKIVDVDTGLPLPNSVPNAQITFSPSAACTTTTFSTMTNTWITTVPMRGDDEIFLTGVPMPSAGLRGGTRVSWNGTFDTGGVQGMTINWKWAAVYTNFATYLNALDVKPGHQTACGQNGADHAGTPEGVNNNNQQWKQFVIGGASGGGGSNWTGSWSGTDAVTPTSVVDPGSGPKS
jgi:hypothetical protein